MISVLCGKYRPLEFIRCIPRIIKHSWQRISKGYCHLDVLDMDVWFLKTVPDMIEELRKSTSSFPATVQYRYIEEHKKELGMDYDTYKIWKFDGGEEDSKREKIDKLCRQEWFRILDRMVFLFREADEDTCSRQSRYLKALEKGDKSAEFDPAEENELREYRDSCLKEALGMFYQYFHNLWD